MKNLYLIVLLIITTLFSAFSQVKITGTIKDKQGEVIPLANVYLKDTFDGTNSDLEGNFSFKTNESGNQTIIVSYIGYKTFEQSVELTKSSFQVNVLLIEEINKIDGVTISAGAFESSDIKKITVLKPMDIVTTASAAGDIMGAINTLPGTSTVGESGRLFVRGGEGYETKVLSMDWKCEMHLVLLLPMYRPVADSAPFFLKVRSSAQAATLRNMVRHFPQHWYSIVTI
jgi:hypothetical protein